jgi:hypothetical protein
MADDDQSVEQVAFTTPEQLLEHVRRTGENATVIRHEVNPLPAHEILPMRVVRDLVLRARALARDLKSVAGGAMTDDQIHEEIKTGTEAGRRLAKHHGPILEMVTTRGRDDDRVFGTLMEMIALRESQEGSDDTDRHTRQVSQFFNQRIMYGDYRK